MVKLLALKQLKTRFKENLTGGLLPEAIPPFSYQN